MPVSWFAAQVASSKRIGIAYRRPHSGTLTAAYRILETRRLADDVVLGYLNRDFSFTDRPADADRVYLSVLVKQSPAGDLISHYQLSRLN
ncbi:hypothetical protein ACWEK5_44115 [Rhodococcus koreensis]